MAMVTATVAIIVFAMVLLPMIGMASNQTVNGEAHEVDLTADVQLAEYEGTEDIAIDATAYTASDGTNSYTTIITKNSAILIVSGTSVTVYDSTGAHSATADITVPATSVLFVNVASNGTYGLWTTISGLAVKNTSTLYVFNDTTFATEKYNGTKIALTYAAVEDQKDIYSITAVDGNNGAVVAPLSYTYYDQVPALDGNIKSIIDIIPIMVIVGLLIGCIAMFFKNRV